MIGKVRDGLWGPDVKVVSVKAYRHTVDFGDGQSAITFCNNCGGTMIGELEDGSDVCWTCLSPVDEKTEDPHHAKETT